MAARMLVVILSCLLLAAHVLRAGLVTPALALGLLPFLLLVRRPWVPPVMQAVMVVAVLEWVRTAVVLTRGRIAAGDPWLRMALILGAVAAIAVGAVLALRHEAVRRHYAATASADAS